MGDIDDEIKFKRYLYFLTENHHYVVKKKENNFSNTVDCLINLLAAEKINKVIEIIEEASKFEWLPNPNVLLHSLALCTRTSDNKEVKTVAYSCAARLIKTTEDLFQFITYERALQKNVSTGLRRVIKIWYLNQDPDKLYEAITTKRSVHGWTHRDILRVAHIKAEDEPKKVLFAYACRGIDHARTQSTKQNKLLLKLESVDNWRTCTDEKTAVELLAKPGGLKEIPGALARSTVVWAALVPQMPLNQLIDELGRFHRLGMLRTGQPVLAAIVEALGNIEKCRKSGLLPATVLLRMKQFERPRPTDPRLRQHLQALSKNQDDKESVTPAVVDRPAYSRSHAVTAALGRLLHHSLRNVRPLSGRRPKLCMVTVEVRGAEGLLRPCFGCPPVRYGEVAALLVLLVQRLVSTQHLKVACFNGPDLLPLEIRSEAGKDGKKEKTGCVTLAQVLQRLRDAGAQCKAGAVPARPLRWALDNRKPVDVFVNVLVTGDGAGRVAKPDRHKEDAAPIADLLAKYRQRAKLANARVLNIALCGRSLEPLTQPKGCAGLLNVVGFNSHVPSIVGSFLAAPVL